MRFYTCLILIALTHFPAFAQKGVHTLIVTLYNAKSDAEKVKAYDEIFRHYQFSSPDSATYYLAQGLTDFKSRNAESGMAAINNMYGLFYSTHGRLVAAKKSFKMALAIYIEHNDKKGIATGHEGLAVVDAKTGNYTEATKQFIEALKIYEALDDAEGAMRIYMRLGEVNSDNNDIDKALVYYDTALNYAVRKSIKGKPLSDIYNNIGIAYAKKASHEKAISYFEKVLAECTGTDAVLQRVRTLNNIGIVYDEMGNGKKALAYFDEAIKLAKENDMPEEYTTAEVSKAAVIVRTNPAAAINVLSAALKGASDMGLQPLQAVIYDNMVEVYTQMGNYKEALAMHELLKKLDDSLFNVNKATEIASLQAVHELEQSNNRLFFAEQRSDANKMMRDVIIGVAVVLAAMLVLLLLVYKKSMRLNAALKVREEELGKSNEVKDRLFSIIGHDLRGPVGNVSVMLQLLQQKGLNAEESKYMLNRMVVHAKATVDTLDKLLYWGQSQIKGIGIKKVDFSVGTHVQTCIELIRPAAEQKQITITNNVPPDTMVNADPAHFEFVLRNLLSNAVKFTYNNGAVTVSVHGQAKQGYVVFAVADTGTGIPADKIEEIFKPFGSSTVGTNDERGTSIGLMLCREFVTENGGEIWVETEPGKGSTFYFSLNAVG